MERSLLIAVDDSRHSRLAAEYAGRFFASDERVHFNLLNIQPPLSDFLVEEARRKASARRKLDQLFKENTAHSHQILATLADALKQSGIAEKRIAVNTLPNDQGTAKDILDFATRDQADAIVLGRRGMSGWQDMLFGSVSNNIIQQSRVLPVWMVDGQPAPGHILVPVDGSQHSLRAVDHLAFILADRQDLRPVFFHVRPKLRQFCAIDFDNAEAATLEDLEATGDRLCIDNFFGQARTRLAEAGIEESQFDIKTSAGLSSVGSQIVKEMETGRYQTVIMGRSGGSRNYFMGSVAQHVINKATDCAVWVVP